MLLLTRESARVEQEVRRLGQLSFRAALRAELVQAETVLWDVGAGRVLQTTTALPMPARDLGSWVASPSDVLRLEIPAGQRLRLDRAVPIEELRRIRIREESPAPR